MTSLLLLLLFTYAAHITVHYAIEASRTTVT